jgi:hypothetical protein
MAFKELDTVVLERDLPEHELMRGDIGAIVNIDPDGTSDVEFVRGSGDTQAVVRLRPADFRPMDDRDMLAVRTPS